MPIYRAEIQTGSDGNYKFDTLVFQNDLENGDHNCNFKGVRQGKDWKPIEFQWYSESDNDTGQSIPKREKANFAHVFADGLKIAVDGKAKAALTPFFGTDVEFLPIKIKNDGSEWHLLNVVHIVDKALSLENSKFKLRSNGSIGRLTKAVFDLNNIPDDRVFIYPQWPSALMVKGDAMEKLVIENGLSGIVFDEYDSV